MSLQEMLILVDSKDQTIGFGEKMMVHRQGLLHRAFSISVFSNDGRLMLRTRARDKYHTDPMDKRVLRTSSTGRKHSRSGTPQTS